MEWMAPYDKNTYTNNQKIWVDKLVRQLVNNCMSPFEIFDVGANIGEITDIMASIMENHDGIIHAFEPNPLLINDLRNKFKKRPCIKVYEDIVSDGKKHKEIFNYSKQAPGSGYLYHSPQPDIISRITDWQIIEKKTVTLDQIVDRNKKTIFIKIDAEGHDFFILQGSTWILENHRPIVLFEFSGRLNSDVYNYSPLDWYNFFEDRHYELIAPMGPRSKKFILSHFNVEHPDLLDIMAFPREKLDLFLKKFNT